MSMAASETSLMKKEKCRPRVTLEPELEEIAGAWPAAKRFEMARKFARWAQQLKVSAKIMTADAQSGRHPRPDLRYVAPRKACLN
jgi:hypothetical protein